MKFEQTKVYGGVGGGTMAKSHGEWLWYNEAIQIKFSCPFQFQNFPFDSHKCCLEYGGLVWNSSQMLLMSARILYRNMTSDEGLITIENLPFPFDMKIESLPAFKKATFSYWNVLHNEKKFLWTVVEWVLLLNTIICCTITGFFFDKTRYCK